MNSKVFIRLKNKETSLESQEITIEDLIFNQSEIVFIFKNSYNKWCMSYKDFLDNQEEYEVIVRIGVKEPCLKVSYD